MFKAFKLIWIPFGEHPLKLERYREDFYTILYCTVLYCTILYYTILYYTILY